MKRVITGLAVAAAAVCWMIAAPAYASEYDELTYFTFSTPVELPGVALPAGTYMFRLPDGNNTRIVQVLSQDGQTIYGMFVTVPEFKANPVNQPTVTFNESSGKAPREIRSWYYQGSNVGGEFIYPEGDTTRLARASTPTPKIGS
jgi:hypothetical protein